MGFVVLHMEKTHGSDSGTTAHIERFIIPKNADPTRTHLNQMCIRDSCLSCRVIIEEATNFGIGCQQLSMN